jgi:hypothetical protein
MRGAPPGVRFRGKAAPVGRRDDRVGKENRVLWIENPVGKRDRGQASR